MENKLKVWLARDKDGKLFAYSCIPYKEINAWTWGSGIHSMELDSDKFPSVKWEDDEPTEAYIALAEPQPKQEQPKEIDWEQRRYEIAKEMMDEIYRQKVVVKTHVQVINPKDIAHFAVAFADTLISTLKNKNK